MTTPVDCSMKHIVLAGIIISVVSLIVSGTFAFTMNNLSNQDTRLRVVEKIQAGVVENVNFIKENQKHMIDSLNKIMVMMTNIKLGEKL